MATPIATLRWRHVEQFLGDTGDLGLPSQDRSRTRPEAVRQLGAQHRLVQAAEHPLMPLQDSAASSAYQRPSAVCTLAEITAWVCSCGSSARDVVWRNVARVKPVASGCRRPPLQRMRVVDPNRSRCSSAADDGDVVRVE